MSVCDQEDVEVLEWSVDETDPGGFYDGVFGSGRDETGERGEEGFESRSGESDELTRK